MPEAVVRGLMKKFRASRKLAEKVTAIAEKSGENAESIYHQVMAGYFSGDKGKPKASGPPKKPRL